MVAPVRMSRPYRTGRYIILVPASDSQSASA